MDLVGRQRSEHEFESLAAVEAPTKQGDLILSASRVIHHRTLLSSTSSNLA
jgi:hypothetical protein